MAKYDALRDHLRRCGEPRITMTFAEIDRIVPGGLPRSAYVHQAWWAYEREPAAHVQKHAIRDAGYHVERYDLNAKTVTFVRGR